MAAWVAWTTDRLSGVSGCPVAVGMQAFEPSLRRPWGGYFRSREANIQVIPTKTAGDRFDNCTDGFDPFQPSQSVPALQGISERQKLVPRFRGLSAPRFRRSMKDAFLALEKRHIGAQSLGRDFQFPNSVRHLTRDRFETSRDSFLTRNETDTFGYCGPGLANQMDIFTNGDRFNIGREHLRKLETESNHRGSTANVDF